MCIADHFEYGALSLTLRKIDIRLKNITAEKGMLEVAQSVVDEAIEVFGLKTLVPILLEDRPGLQTLMDIKALIESEPPAGAGTALACHEHYLLPGSLPFLDREKFRAIANHFNKPGPRILTIKGLGGTGKTYSKEFVFHLAQARKAEGDDLFHPVWVDLAPSTTARTTQLSSGLTVITEIANQISEVELPEKYETSFTEKKEQAATWAKSVGSWLTGALSDSVEIYWVILDGFNKGPITESATLLIDDLIGRVGNNLTAIRLILLGFADENFKSYSVQRHEDETRDLTDPKFKQELYEELGEFLLQANAAGYENVADDDLADVIADDANALLRDIDPGKGDQMEELADELKRKALTYSQGAGA
jgi:hypothetical protein